MIYEKEKRYIIPFDDVPAERAEMPEISVDDRRENFTEVETGFPEKMAQEEARRCLSCRRCLGCALCWAECEPEAIDFTIPDKKMDLSVDEVIITRGQENAFHPVKKGLGYGDFADVISDLQFERMLSPTGPTNGLVVSPKTGDIPEKIAIIQGFGDEGDQLSAQVLGVNEAIIALERTEGLAVDLVAPLCDDFNGKFKTDAEKVAGLTLKDAMASAVERKAEEGPLSVTTDGDAAGDYDMVVVLTRPKPSPEITALSRKLDQPVI